MKREYHITENGMVTFVYSILGQLEEHPRRDVQKMVRSKLKKEFGVAYKKQTLK